MSTRFNGRNKSASSRKLHPHVASSAKFQLINAGICNSTIICVNVYFGDTSRTSREAKYRTIRHIMKFSVKRFMSSKHTKEIQIYLTTFLYFVFTSFGGAKCVGKLQNGER